MFERARLILTAWYLAIIMSVSLLFSFFIYTNINVEFHRFEQLEGVRERQEQRLHVSRPLPRSRVDPELIQGARTRLITTLGIVNLIIFATSGIAGYFLAGRTLRSIKQMIDELNRFISDASHELRTPLTSLRSEMEVYLLNKRHTSVQLRKLVESNLEEVIHLQALSDNLLELTQYEKLNARTSFTPIFLKDIIHESIKKVQGLAKKKDIIIKQMGDEITTKGNRDRLRELFTILLDNAIKYSEPKNTVTIALSSTDHAAIITVSDAGVGISGEDLPYIFGRFYRADKSRSKEVEGFGLGLSIAKKIVDVHKGSISVKSKVDEGTIFSVILPKLS